MLFVSRETKVNNLSSVSSENYGFPSTMFEFGGLGAELMFFKGMFDKVDIEMQVIRGSNNDFKSAVEPFFLEKMSDSSKHQLQRYLNSMWEDIRYSIRSSRSIPSEFADITSKSNSVSKETTANETSEELYVARLRPG